jgi:hypothetical protein
MDLLFRFSLPLIYCVRFICLFIQQVFDSIKISTVFDEAISILPFDVLVAVDKVDVIGSTLDEGLCES